MFSRKTNPKLHFFLSLKSVSFVLFAVFVFQQNPLLKKFVKIGICFSWKHGVISSMTTKTKICILKIKLTPSSILGARISKILC